jgi:D-3-phosphoglycerate dehydrogenase
MGLMLALCRNIPQAARLPRRGNRDRASFKGTELYGKTLGVLGFGRIGQARRRAGPGLRHAGNRVDRFVTAERFRELGVDGVEEPGQLYARADFITLHLPSTPETENIIDPAAIEQMREGVRIVNCARGDLIDLDALVQGLESGRVAGAALDVFPEEPFSGHPILERDERRRHASPRRLDR